MTLSTEVQDAAAAHPDWVEAYERGTEIIHEGGLPVGFHVLVEGRVVLAHAQEDSGSQRMLRIVGLGQAIGFAEVLAEMPFRTSARALEAVRTLHVNRDRIAELFASAPALAVELARDLAEETCALPTAIAPADVPETPLQAMVSESQEESEPEASPAPSSEPDRATAPRGAPLSLAPSLRSGPRPPEPETPNGTKNPSEKKKDSLSAFYDESVQCPICETQFTALRVRTSAINASKRDSDMRMTYDGVNPVHYAIYVCPTCRYSAYEDGWDSLDPDDLSQLVADRAEREEATATFDLSGERDLDEVAITFLLALRCYDLQEPDPRRRAGILHRLAWTARESEQTEAELEYLDLARVGYEAAFEADTNLSDGAAATMAFLIGDLALRTGDGVSALKWFERCRSAKPSAEVARLLSVRWSDARELQKQGA